MGLVQEPSKTVAEEGSGNCEELDAAVNCNPSLVSLIPLPFCQALQALGVRPVSVAGPLDVPVVALACRHGSPLPWARFFAVGRVEGVAARADVLVVVLVSRCSVLACSDRHRCQVFPGKEPLRKLPVYLHGWSPGLPKDLLSWALTATKTCTLGFRCRCKTV